MEQMFSLQGSATVSVAPVGVPPTELRPLPLEYLNSYKMDWIVCRTARSSVSLTKS